MRILHTIHSMSPESGGPTAVVRQLAQTARQAGLYETEVVTLDAPGQAFLECDGVPVHGVGPGLGKYGYTRRLDQWLRANLGRFDGVVVNGLWQYHGLASWRACRGKKPFLVYAHGMLDPWFRQAYPLKHLKKSLYWRAAERHLLRAAAAVLFTTDTEAEFAPQTFGESDWTGFVIPHATLGPSGDRDLQTQRFYAVCPQVRRRPFLLFLGRIHEKKGCDLLLQAFARLALSDAETQLVVAGPDEQGRKADLLALAARGGVADRVHFPGMLHGDEKWGAFYAAEAFVLPSHQENFGVAVAEALACGTPALISNKVNIWQEIEADGVGLVEDDTLDGTCRLLERWRKLPAADRAAMAARCAPSFQRRYDMKQVPDVIAGLFDRALRGAPITPRL